VSLHAGLKARLAGLGVGAILLFSGAKLCSREKRRLVDHRQDWACDQVPVRIEVGRIDRLDVEDVLSVVGAAMSKLVLF
jgi:hypothetical protein